MNEIFYFFFSTFSMKMRKKTLRFDENTGKFELHPHTVVWLTAINDCSEFPRVYDICSCT